MKLSIPTIGTRLTLTKAWSFKLHDDYRNEKFWRALHGAPVRQPYYYGWDQVSHSYLNSPTPTTVCTSLGEHKAPPVKTVLPKGTTLSIDRLYVRKGLKDFDSISFRIVKEGNSPIPSGRFWAHIDDINGKLDASLTDAKARYPNGRFTLQIIKGTRGQCTNCHQWQGNCKCAAPTNPRFRDEYLHWTSDPENRYDSFTVHSVHSTDSTGKDDIHTDRHRCQADGYIKHFDRIEDCLNWASSQKNFTQAHLDAFVAIYDQKRIEWEAKKATDKA